jgi:hypothetical protein
MARNMGKMIKTWEMWELWVASRVASSSQRSDILPVNMYPGHFSSTPRKIWGYLKIWEFHSFSTAKKKETCIELEILQEIVVNYTIAIFLGVAIYVFNHPEVDRLLNFRTTI